MGRIVEARIIEKSRIPLLASYERKRVTRDEPIRIPVGPGTVGQPVDTRIGRFTVRQSTERGSTTTRVDIFPAPGNTLEDLRVTNASGDRVDSSIVYFQKDDPEIVTYNLGSENGASDNETLVFLDRRRRTEIHLKLARDNAS